MVLTIHGTALATCTQRVMATCKEKGVPYTIKKIDFASGEHKTQAYLDNLQPFGVIPVLEDDGFKVYESRAICRYIATKYAGQGTALIPHDVKANAIFEQAASCETAYFDPSASGIAFEKVFKKWRGLETDPKRVEELKAKLGAYLDVYNTILSKTPYLAGSEFTLADLLHLPYAQKLYDGGEGELIDSRPNVKAWYDRISSRPSWVETIAEGK